MENTKANRANRWGCEAKGNGFIKPAGHMAVSKALRDDREEAEVFPVTASEQAFLDSHGS